jgi:tRNA nucleotidyltransferase (CCA-adding enzyme)
MNEYLETGKSVIKTLKQNNFDAYFVGGYVRDFKLGLKSNDIDITTSATPSEVETLFKKVVHTGKNFGGVTVIMNDYKFEVTTFRLEGKYEQHRYPKEVEFSTNVLDDLKRRDFTINQLIMDENEIVYDNFNGLEDIKAKRIKTIGNPHTRFDEDALRILRAFRFVSKLGFDIEETTLQAITDVKELVQTITIERIMNELDKIFQGDHQKKAIHYMNITGISDVLYGLREGLKYIETLDDFVYPIEAFIISFILGEQDDIWRFSNRQKDVIGQTVFLHEITKEDAFNKFILFSNKLDPCLLVNRINVLMGYKDQEEDIMAMYQDMPVMDVCDLKFKGQDILALSTLKSTKLIGRVIDDLLFNVIMGIMPNDYQILKEFALKRIDQIQKELGV